MRPETTKWLAHLRAQAIEPGTVFVAIRARARSFLIFPEEILSMTDDQLLHFIRQGLASVQNRTEIGRGACAM